jgi:hypothetical protein
MPIDNLQEAAQKIAAFLASLNKLGGMRLKFRISAPDGAPASSDPEDQAPALSVELAGPDAPLLVQHNGELLLALETIAAQILRLDQRESGLVSFDAANFKALRAADGRKGPPLRHSLRLPAHEQPRTPPNAHGLPRHRGRGDGQQWRRPRPLSRRLPRGQNRPAGHAASQAAQLRRSRPKLWRSWTLAALATCGGAKRSLLARNGFLACAQMNN